MFFCQKINFLQVSGVPEFIPEEVKPVSRKEKVAPIKGTQEDILYWNHSLNKQFIYLILDSLCCKNVLPFYVLILFHGCCNFRACNCVVLYVSCCFLIKMIVILSSCL